MGFFDGKKSQEDKQIEILQFRLKMAQDKKDTAADRKKLEQLMKGAKRKKGFWDF
jgi:hypothetical protein